MLPGPVPPGCSASLPADEADDVRWGLSVNVLEIWPLAPVSPSCNAGSSTTQTNMPGGE